MLDGIGSNEIIVGAYTDRDGRVCPMLAAHRAGGRTSLASFARAWDRYTGARRPRPASEREVRTLTAMLEASLYYDDESPELAAAAAAHRASLERNGVPPTKRRRRDRRPTGETSRLGELRDRHGWSWLRVFRRYDDYTAALAQLESEERAAGHASSEEREKVS
jgi:hypothetical protein